MKICRILKICLILSCLITDILIISCRSQYHEQSHNQTNIIDIDNEVEINQKEQEQSLSYSGESYTVKKAINSNNKAIKSYKISYKKNIYTVSPLTEKSTKMLMKEPVKKTNTTLTKNLSLVSVYVGLTAFILSFIVPQIALLLALFSILMEGIVLIRTLLYPSSFDQKKVRRMLFNSFVCILAIIISIVMMKE